MNAYVQFILAMQLATTVANLALGAFVLFKNPRNVVNVAFTFFVLGAAGWNLAIFLTIIGTAPLWWGRLAFSFVALVPAGMWWLSDAMRERERLGILKQAVPLLIGAIFFIIPLTEYMITAVVPKDGYITGSFGPLYLYWYVYFFPALFLVFAKIIIQVLRQKGAATAQFQYLFLGAASFLVPFCVTNLLMPLIFGIYDYNNLGPLFTVPMILIIAYGIVKHHLFDIQVIIRRGAIFTLLFSIISFIYALLSNVVGAVLPGNLKYIAPSILVAVGFIPLKSFLEHATDSVFFRKRYKLEDVLVELERVMYGAGLNMDSLLAAFNRLIIDTLHADKGTILILIPKDSFITRQVINSKDENVVLGFDDPLIGALTKPGFSIIDKDDILTHAEHLGRHDPTHLHDRGLAERLEKIGFDLAIPLKIKGDLIGVYLLGGKKSGDPFFGNDLKLLEHAVRAIGPLIENARMFEELKKLDDAKSNFIATASHQLRTPLSSVRWNLELLRDGGISAKEKSVLSDSIYFNIILTIGRLNALLVVLDIDQGKLFVSASKNDIVAEVKAAADLVKKESGIEAKARITTAFDAMEAIYDRDKVKAALYAVINNAFTYSDRNKPVSISIYSQFVAGEKRMIIAVTDQGIGIDERTKPYIFYKFFRGEAARTAAPSGFGLNLFVAKSYIKAHGGDIWFESSGPGTTFFIALPAVYHEKK